MASAWAFAIVASLAMLTAMLVWIFVPRDTVDAEAAGLGDADPFALVLDDQAQVLHRHADPLIV